VKPGAWTVIPTPPYTYNTLVLTAVWLHLSSRNWLLVLFLVLKSLRLVYKQNNRMERTVPAAMCFYTEATSYQSRAWAVQQLQDKWNCQKCSQTSARNFLTPKQILVQNFLRACSLPRLGLNKIILSVRLTVRVYIDHNRRKARWIFIIYIEEF
jgi:hypothetical protein